MVGDGGFFFFFKGVWGIFLFLYGGGAFAAESLRIAASCTRNMIFIPFSVGNSGGNSGDGP